MSKFDEPRSLNEHLYDLAHTIRESGSKTVFDDYCEVVFKPLFYVMLYKAKKNVSDVCKRLNVSRGVVKRYIEKYGLEEEI